MENIFYISRFKVQYVKNKSLFPPNQDMVTTYILAKDKAEAIQFVRCLPGFVELRAINFDYIPLF